MRTWKLSAGDPLHLTLAADARLGPTDYGNDIIWELNLGTGEPPALAVQTNFGLRARWMQFFPIFTRAGVSVIDPADFFRPPQVIRFFPNYFEVTFAPFDGIEARAEYRVADSQALAGRLRLTNKSVLPHNLRLDWACVLSPLGFGEGMAALPMGLGTVLQGRTDGISVVCFLTRRPAAQQRHLTRGSPCSWTSTPAPTRRSTWAAAAQASRRGRLRPGPGGRRAPLGGRSCAPRAAQQPRMSSRSPPATPNGTRVLALGQRAALRPADGQPRAPAGHLVRALPPHRPGRLVARGRQRPSLSVVRADRPGQLVPGLAAARPAQTWPKACCATSSPPREQGYPDFTPGPGRAAHPPPGPAAARRSGACSPLRRPFLEEAYPRPAGIFQDPG